MSCVNYRNKVQLSLFRKAWYRPRFVWFSDNWALVAQQLAIHFKGSFKMDLNINAQQT